MRWQDAWRRCEVWALGPLEAHGAAARVAERLAALDGGGDQLRIPVDAGRMDG